MAAAKRYTPEQIVVKMREHEKLQGQRVDDPAGVQADRRERPDVLSVAHEVRGVEGGRGASPEGFGDGELAVETDRRRAGFGHFDVEGFAEGKMVSPSRRRDAVVYLVGRHPVS